MKPETLHYLDTLRTLLRRDRARYATNFWRGVDYDPATQGPAWDVFVRPAHTTCRP